MKNLFAIAFIFFLSITAFAQEKYQYVIIPTHLPGIGSGLDPYGVSSSLQKILSEKSIKSTFKQDLLPDDFCKALTANIEKVPNLFRSKVKIEFKDCRNQTIWSAEGTGMSKSFREGYAEALVDALEKFEMLPVNQSLQYEVPKVVTSPPVIQKPANQETRIKSTVKKIPSKQPVAQSSERIYKPLNLFYNYSYFVDLVENDNGNKELMIINGELLGYENLEIIATLTPSGLENVYTVEWRNEDSSKLTGVANLLNGNLKISLQNGDDKLVIQLQKY